MEDGVLKISLRLMFRRSSCCEEGLLQSVHVFVSLCLAHACRSQRLTPEQFLQRQRDEGNEPSVLFSSPGFKSTCCKWDWLHAVDLGISQDFLGACFKHVAETYMPGASFNGQCNELFKQMQTFYKRVEAEDRLNTLTPGMLQKDKKAKKRSWPKLRAKAGETRALVPFCRELVEKYCVTDSDMEVTMRRAARVLESCYDCLHDSVWKREVLEARARRFAVLFVKLTSLPGQKLFRAKPKLHAFLEIAASPANPRRTWSYRDESFGHTLSKHAVRRGGEFSMLGVSRAMLQKFAASNPKPPLLRASSVKKRLQTVLY